jgi:hypothetical protein
MADLEKPGTKEELHRWGTTLVDDGEMRRRHWEGIWWENIATYCGDFWVQWDIHRRTLTEPVKKPKHRARIPINLAQPVVRTELAKLVKNKPIADVQASDDSTKAMNAAKVGDKMLNIYAEREFHLAKVRRRALHWVLMTGFGGIFVDWDESAETPIEVYSVNDEPIFDERVIRGYQQQKKKNPERESLNKMFIPQGELVIKSLSPFQLIWDFSQNYVEDASWLIVTDVYDVNEVERRWDEEVDAEGDVEPGVIEKRLIAKMDLTSRLSFKEPDGQELCKIHRLFVKPGHPYFPNGLHMVFNKDKIIHREPYPFRHGELPVSTMGHIPLPISQFPMSVLQQVRPPVIELSKTESQLLDNRNLMANPPWMIPDQARIEGEIQNKPGARIRYRHTPNVPPPAPAEMPEIPQYVKDLVPMLKEHILEISGQGETSQGRVPPGARSGVAIAYLQEEDDTRLGPTVSEFEEMWERAGYMLLETISEKYDIPRTVTIYKKHGEPEVFDFVGTMIEGNTNVVVQAGSALPRSKAAKQQFILDLWDRRLEQDPRKVREMLELSQGEPDEWDIDLDEAERENRSLMRGQQVEVKEWQNHPAHHFQHRRFMKSADFSELPEDVQRVMEDHDAEHTAFEQQQQRELQWAQGGGEMGGPEMGSENGAQPAGEGQNVPEGPPPEFSPGESPAGGLSSQLDYGPQ